MSNGYLLAAEADFVAASEIAEGFGLEVISVASIAARDATAALADAANVGIVLSTAAAQDNAFVALMRNLAPALRNAQLILATPEARSAFAFLPEAWPSMSLDEARSRSAELVRRRQEGATEPPRAHPLPPVEDTTRAPESVPDEPLGDELATASERDHEEPSAPADDQPEAGPDLDGAVGGGAAESEGFGAEQETGAVEEAPIPNDLPAAPPSHDAPAEETPAPPASVAPTPAPQAVEPPPRPSRTRAVPADSAQADATAFAPKKLRRGSPELIRIVIHQPQDLQAVIKAAKKLDPRTDPAPSGMKVGDVPIGASVGVSLEVRGASCNGALQRRIWTGEAIDFNFSAEPDEDVKQAVFLARVFVDDAQIGVLAFTRPIGGANKNAASTGDRVRLRRHKRVFLSYSSKDRETVAAIATAYQAAGVQHFFDRTSLKSGEEWSPRLRKEIDHADLFHLCWSKSAAASEWVEKEAEHALTRRYRSNGKRPEITVQMLDGPPWAKHPPHLDSINFDDFVRAAIVGYARGDGSQ